jgi:GNAT superfamily N-acetyltransferase
MIRPATLDDIPAVLAMGKRFADEAGVTALVGWNDDNVTAMLELMIAEHILLVGDRGMIGGFLFPHPFSGRLIFQEQFWRNEGPPMQGVRLLEAVETEAKARGCEIMHMIEIATFPGAERVYLRRGYAPAERNFTKRL